MFDLLILLVQRSLQVYQQNLYLVDASVAPPLNLKIFISVLGMFYLRFIYIFKMWYNRGLVSNEMKKSLPFQKTICVCEEDIDLASH